MCVHVLDVTAHPSPLCRRPRINAPVDPKQWVNKTVPPGFPIRVDEVAETVTVAAGIPQRVLLDYLSEYK